MIPPLAANLQVLFFPNRTVFDGTGIGETSTQVTARVIADTSRHDWVTVFWMGHNNIVDPARVKADFAAAIGALSPGNNRYIVLSLLNEATPRGIKGGVDYAVVMQLNADLAATHPDNYLDVRSHLVSQYDPSIAQDVADHANDVTPSSLRYDEIHLRNAGSVMVATKVSEFINARGW